MTHSGATSQVLASLSRPPPPWYSPAMQSVEVTAKLLAEEHAREDQGIERILWVPAANEVRLIEVTNSVTDRGEILPFRFSPDPPDVPYPSVVILLGPGDWRRLKAKELDLPESFGGDCEQIFPV